MGLFDLFKKKEIVKTNEKNTNGDEVDIFSSDGLLEYINSNLKNPTDENVLKVLDNIVKPAEDLTHLDENGELPWGWHTQNKDFTESINNKYSYFLKNWLDSRYGEPKKYYEALKSFVLYLEDVEKLCKAKDECFEFWFTKVLTSPTYLQERKKELKELAENLDKLQFQYREKQAELYNLDEKIIKKLKENQGILQSEFVKTFNPLIQNEVKDELYHLDKEGKLQRTKSGRSYILNFRG